MLASDAPTGGYPGPDRSGGAAGVIPNAERPPANVGECGLLLLHGEMVQSLQSRLGTEAAMGQLDGMGMTTGLRLVTRLSAGRFPVVSERNVMKFICKELWPQVFRKAASRLQTDRRGNYIIQDTSFRWLEQFPAMEGDDARNAQLHEAAMLQLALPCGLIRGALLALGVECHVTAQVSLPVLPACSFTVALKETREAPSESPSPV
eukprot:TRINITY_DN33485_c0_g1_i1.p1 TRINITY_DN33485_c0_g1~~TRINITY_DN33485_c0_g1_i1.p1  ORF type:complete len:206 (+),score=21.34 TRINITY_DN33485_c0_g1_i1:131-748(+)